MPSQTTMSLGSMAPGARVRPDHPTPVPLSPLPVYCEQGQIATLTSCTPPWMQLGVTYLRPRLVPPQPTLVRAPIPWLTIIAVATAAAVVAIVAAHLLSIVAAVHTVDSALWTHADDLADVTIAPAEPRVMTTPPRRAPLRRPPAFPAPRSTAEAGHPQGQWIIPIPAPSTLPFPFPERYYEDVKR